MKRFLKNTLLLKAIGLYGAYLLAGILIDRPYVASTVAILAMMAGMALFTRYYSKAWDILIHQARADFGGHFAILGAMEIASGLIYSGAYRTIWNWYGTPHSWVGSAFGSFGLFIIAHGVYLVARSPDTPDFGGRYPPYLWNNIIWISAVLFAFIAGTQINQFVN